MPPSLAARELLGSEDQRVERIMLELRVVEGLAVSVLTVDGVLPAGQAAEDDLLRSDALSAGRCVLTDRGRLLADAVVQRLL